MLIAFFLSLILGSHVTPAPGTINQGGACGSTTIAPEAPHSEQGQVVGPR